jgi:hypothetical protein
MKIRDIINETRKRLPQTVRKAGVHARHYDKMDTFYDLYRFGIAMAANKSPAQHAQGPIGDNPSVWMYTDADAEIVNDAEKAQGVKSRTIVKNPSSEPKTTNVKSPVAKRKKNKYGV